MENSISRKDKHIFIFVMMTSKVRDMLAPISTAITCVIQTGTIIKYTRRIYCHWQLQNCMIGNVMREDNGEFYFTERQTHFVFVMMTSKVRDMLAPISTAITCVIQTGTIIKYTRRIYCHWQLQNCMIGNVMREDNGEFYFTERQTHFIFVMMTSKVRDMLAPISTAITCVIQTGTIIKYTRRIHCHRQLQTCMIGNVMREDNGEFYFTERQTHFYFCNDDFER